MTEGAINCGGDTDSQEVDIAGLGTLTFVADQPFHPDQGIGGFSAGNSLFRPKTVTIDLATDGLGGEEDRLKVPETARVGHSPGACFCLPPPTGE